MTVDASGAVVPTCDVLPSGVRRRLGRRDARLGGVLAAEFLLGMALGLAWDARAELGQVWVPAPMASSTRSDDGRDGSGATSTSAMTTSWVVVGPPPTPPPPPPPPLRTEPRNPFAVQAP